jgi:hypothetical protein
MKEMKLKFDKEAMKKTCHFAIESEQKKGNPILNDDGTLMTKDQCYQENLKLFEDPIFIKAVMDMSNKKMPS